MPVVAYATRLRKPGSISNRAKRNLRGAFAIDMDVRGKRIILIDDVMTSGSSLNELARTVRKAGALEIQAWVLARTL
jgi:predicted amidophosphoribosyltransferase